MSRAKAETAIAILARAPVPGRAKTRLIPLLGAHGAAAFSERMIEHMVETACRAEIGPVVVWATDMHHAAFRELATRFPITLAQQPDGDLGVRMAACVEASFSPPPLWGRVVRTERSEAKRSEDREGGPDANARSYPPPDRFAVDLPHKGGGERKESAHSHTPTLIIGTDCPVLTPAHLQDAAAALHAGADAVAIPVEDGGYVLIGMHRLYREFFDDVRWSVPSVMAETRRRARTLGLKLHELETLWDVDRPEDFERMEREGIGVFA